jgi:O-antigen/teichoic acid export membrane protein
VMDHIGLHLDRVLLGYFTSATAVGLYTNSQRWSFYPLEQVYLPLRNVAIASLSRLQTDPKAYRTACRGAFLPVLSLVLPALAFMVVEAHGVVLVLLGDQWLAAVPLFRVMCIAGFARAMIMVTGWLYLSQGHTRRQFRWGVVYTCVMVLAVTVGVLWGPYGVAVGFTVGTCLLTYPTIAYCLKASHLRMREFLAIVSRPALASIGAAAALFAGEPFLGPGRGLVLDVLIKLAIFGLLYLVLWVGVPGGRRAMQDLVLIVKEVLPKEASRSA